MSTNRRNFIKISTAAGGAALSSGLIPNAFSLAHRTHLVDTSQAGKASKPLRILILGGTGYTGPYQVRYALARGHQVTVFNRGKTHPGELPKEASN